MSNSNIAMIVEFIGGLGLFLYGMHVMGAGLQKAAGGRMKKLIASLTKNKLLGVLVGAVVTAIIHSSAATTIMVVGFVNAGIMDLSQTVGIIMGANIGTTITAWIVSLAGVSADATESFSLTSALAPLAVACGAFVVMLVRDSKKKQVGEIIIGLGLLFIGMETMSGAVAPLSEVQAFKDIFIHLGANPILGLLAGAIITALLQSSTASVGILQALAASGLVPWNAAVYLIMGQNIGTCVTTVLSAIGASKNAKSAAYIHLLFNIIGSVIFSIIAIITFSFVNPALGNSLITKIEIGYVHTGFNLASTFLLYGFSDYIIILAQKLASLGKVGEDEAALVHLDDRILANPAVAIDSAIKEIVRMARIALENLKLSSEALLEKDEAKIQKVLRREKNIDALEKGIMEYLVKLSNEDITDDENEKIIYLFRTVNDVERIGDHCENISELAQFSITENVVMSDVAYGELTQIVEMTVKSLEKAIQALEENNKEAAKEVVQLEDNVDVLEDAMRVNHIKRLSNKECSSENSVVFLDTLTNLERISDHALNVAQYVLK